MLIKIVRKERLSYLYVRTYVRTYVVRYLRTLLAYYIVVLFINKIQYLSFLYCYLRFSSIAITKDYNIMVL